MPRLLVYVMTEDTGKAPKVVGDVCILDGCKDGIEKGGNCADVDEWIIGIGGKTLSKNCKKDYDRKMIYAMKVEQRKPPRSKHFTHYGNKAISINKFKKIASMKSRTHYFDDPKLYKRFDKFMEDQPSGKIGSYCCGGSCKASPKC